MADPHRRRLLRHPVPEQSQRTDSRKHQRGGRRGHDQQDLLPPGYTYVSGSSEGYTGNLSTSTPAMSWQSDSERWRLRWQKPGEEPPPIAALAPGETRTQVLKATATLSAGATYYNDAYGTWSTDDPDECEDAIEGEKGGITAAGAAVEAPVYFDVSTVASNGTVQARVLLSWPDGTVEIVSSKQPSPSHRQSPFAGCTGCRPGTTKVLDDTRGLLVQNYYPTRYFWPCE